MATKTGDRDGGAARESLERSLRRMEIDQVDMIQLHNLVDEAEWEQAFAPGGAVEALEACRASGLMETMGLSEEEFGALCDRVYGVAVDADARDVLLDLTVDPAASLYTNDLARAAGPAGRVAVLSSTAASDGRQDWILSFPSGPALRAFFHQYGRARIANASVTGHQPLAPSDAVW